MAVKSEMSIANPKERAKGVMEAKLELRAFNDEMAKGEIFMQEKREPFCRACMWQEHQQRLKIFELQKGMGAPTKDLELPNWQEYSGKDKFRFTGKVERKNRKEGLIDSEENWSCLKNPKHCVCIMSSRAWHPELGMMASKE